MELGSKKIDPMQQTDFVKISTKVCREQVTSIFSEHSSIAAVHTSMMRDKSERENVIPIGHDTFPRGKH